MTLFAPKLDDHIGPDHPVRLFDELLGSMDWSAWEAEYHGRRGQPPIHPRVLAGAILYGLSRRLRSTRELQDACVHRLDFIWLVEGRQIDYSTFAKFRTRFGQPLKELFRAIGRVALNLGLIRLCEKWPSTARASRPTTAATTPALRRRWRKSSPRSTPSSTS
jgi:transposase